MENILVAVDGSENAERALMKAKEIGKAFNSKITILHVVEIVTRTAYDYMNEEAIDRKNQLEKDIKENSKKLLDTYMEKFKDYNNLVCTLIKSGEPGDIILETAEEGYSLLIIGSRGLGAVSRLVLGSVSHKVVNYTKIPILIVK